MNANISKILYQIADIADRLVEDAQEAHGKMCRVDPELIEGLRRALEALTVAEVAAGQEIDRAAGVAV